MHGIVYELFWTKLAGLLGRYCRAVLHSRELRLRSTTANPKRSAERPSRPRRSSRKCGARSKVQSNGNPLDGSRNAGRIGAC